MSFLHQTTTSSLALPSVDLLYLMSFLHQTTTDFGACRAVCCCISCHSYIKPQLRGHLLNPAHRCISCHSYIKPQLLHWPCPPLTCCISCHSYIKPQPCPMMYKHRKVVSHVIPTSNHNSLCKHPALVLLYLMSFLHQTTTTGERDCSSNCCISCHSYIKPQPFAGSWWITYVVSHVIPTSNHNLSLVLGG